jgi:hypothetical protein
VITVYRFASGSCDSTNLWGHAAIAFNGLPHKECFAISQMKDDGSNPTWHNSSTLVTGARHPGQSQPTHRWRRQFFDKRVDHAFPRVMEKAFIISNEDLERIGVDVPENEGLSERKAFNWWNAQIRNTDVMSRALDGADCSDTVYRAINAAIVRDGHRYASSRTLLRPFMTPRAVVEYARETEAALERLLGLTQDQVNLVRDRDKMWRLALGTYDHISEVVVDQRVSDRDELPLLLETN